MTDRTVALRDQRRSLTRLTPETGLSRASRAVDPLPLVGPNGHLPAHVRQVERFRNRPGTERPLRSASYVRGVSCQCVGDGIDSTTATPAMTCSMIEWRRWSAYYKAATARDLRQLDTPFSTSGERRVSWRWLIWTTPVAAVPDPVARRSSKELTRRISALFVRAATWQLPHQEQVARVFRPRCTQEMSSYCPGGSLKSRTRMVIGRLMASPVVLVAGS